MRNWSVVAVLCVAGCASGPGPDGGLRSVEGPPPALADVADPEPGEIATERIVVETEIGDAGLEGLVRAIGRFVAPGSWGPAYGTAMYADGNAIVVRHSPAAREAVRAALRAMAGAEGRVATVTARVFELEPEDVAALEAASAAEGGLVDVYNTVALRRVADGWMKREGAHLISAPKLTILAGQAGTITIADQVAYIRGFERQTDETATVWDPVVGTINAGLTLDVAVIPNGTGSEDMLLRFAVETRRLYDARDSMPVLRQGMRTTQLPRIAGSRVAATVSLRAGQAIVAIASEPPSSEGDARLMAVVIEAVWEK